MLLLVLRELIPLLLLVVVIIMIMIKSMVILMIVTVALKFVQIRSRYVAPYTPLPLRSCGTGWHRYRKRPPKGRDGRLG